ncbi:probable calcium-binding protein CML9 [Miscanthus floridulus]|uniref:probable calcium-binding protein CML9 n=1 Tax=Miscanthus floridulus TaxID=154761 RepID=UPI003457B0D5
MVIVTLFSDDQGKGGLPLPVPDRNLLFTLLTCRNRVRIRESFALPRQNRRSIRSKRKRLRRLKVERVARVSNMAEKLTPEQVDECKEIFDQFDADEDGRIATGELVTALRSLGQNVDEAEARRSLGQNVDEAEALRSIDLAAFLAVAARKMGARQSEERLAECFDVFDDARSGSIPAEQLRQVMVSHGDRLTEDEADAMLREADPTTEGRVEYKHYVKVLLRDK